MKIGILIDQLNVGGVEKIAIEQVHALRGQQVNASLVVLRKKNFTDKTFSDLLQGLPIIYLDQRLKPVFRFSFKFPVFSFFSLFHITYPFFIPGVIKKNEFDYIICHGTYTSFTAINIKKRNHINFSSFIWDPIGYILERAYANKFPKYMLIPLRSLGRAFDTLIIKSSDNILVGGNAHDKYLHSLYGKVNIITIPPSVHTIKKPLNNKDDYVLMLTAWKRGKNPEYILELIKKMPKLKIKMAGKWLDSAYENEFRDLIKSQGIAESIEVIGGVSEDRLKKLYTRTKVVLQTNDDRGFGMPALEAAANGTTFIVPKGQGVCELFEDKVDGFYTKEKDTKAIVQYLKLLMSDVVLNKKMSNHAWKKVSDNYSWDKHAKKLINLAEKYAS